MYLFVYLYTYLFIYIILYLFIYLYILLYSDFGPLSGEILAVLRCKEVDARRSNTEYVKERIC